MVSEFCWPSTKQNRCNVKGHLSNVCLKTHFNDMIRCETLMVVKLTNPALDNYHDVAPRLPLTIHHSKASFSFQSFPERGASTTIVTSDVARKTQMHIETLDMEASSVTVDNSNIPMLFSTEIDLQTPNTSINTLAMESPIFSNNINIGFKNQINLNVIPP